MSDYINEWQIGIKMQDFCWDDLNFFYVCVQTKKPVKLLLSKMYKILGHLIINFCAHTHHRIWWVFYFIGIWCTLPILHIWHDEFKSQRVVIISEGTFIFFDRDLSSPFLDDDIWKYLGTNQKLFLFFSMIKLLP